jgi:FKBP-type peptidyl-prolyl cis-trans isomerase
MKFKLFFTLFCFALVFSFISCEKEVDEREADELIRLRAYIKVNYPDIDSTESGIYYIIYDLGDSENGKKPENDDFVLYDFVGMSLDEYVFETTKKDIAVLHNIFLAKTHYVPLFKEYNNATQPILAGLKEGLSMLYDGGKARLIIPSRLAYGSLSNGSLRPFSSVIFDVELKRVVTDPEAYEQELIDNYLLENYPDLIPDSIIKDSVYFLVVTPNEIESKGKEDGEDEDPHQPINDSDVVTLNYQGKFFDDFLFDTNIKSVAVANNIYDSNRTYESIEVTIGGIEYIDGFSKALKNLTTNTYAKVIIPSYLAYGKNGSNSIPPYAPLIFELDILGKTTPSSK